MPYRMTYTRFPLWTVSLGIVIGVSIKVMNRPSTVVIADLQDLLNAEINSRA